MKILFCTLFLCLTPYFLHAQTYTIPGATVQPAWVFPLWFEDALGNKDTLYFGYDPEAEDWGIPSSDSVYGEIVISIDTSKFNVLWGSLDYSELTGRKVSVRSNTFSNSIAFYHTFFPPLILRWDKNLFYSNALPFPENEGAPRAWGEIITEGDMVPLGECSFQYPYIMTDTPTLAGLACYLADSMVFQYGSLSGLSFEIKPWQPYWTGLENSTETSDRIFFFPNPLIENEITIYSTNTQDINLTIFDMHSHLVFKTKLTGSTKYNISLNIPQGMYVIQFQQDNIFQSSQFIKL